MILEPKSLFSILVLDEVDTLERLLEMVPHELDHQGLQRLEVALNGFCKCIVVERHYIDKDYRDTFSHFHSKRFSTPSSRCVRLHFFSEIVDENNIVDENDGVKNSYLGYSVIRPTKPNCIGRTLISHSARLDGKSHLCICSEKTLLLGTEFKVIGFPFISQDVDATVCAESALWMIFRYFSNRYSVYSEILPFQVTSLAANHGIGRRVYPSPGLYSWQLAEALRLKNFAPVTYSRKQYGENFNHLLYTYIESGIPLLLTVPRHVVVGFGHASDFTLDAIPSPSKRWAFSSCFNTSFIINDDNKYPYQVLRVSGNNQKSDSGYSAADIEEFIVPLPERVFLTAEQFQAVVERLLNHPKYGLSSVAPQLDSVPLVLRIFLTSSRSFKKKLRDRGMGNPLVERFYRQAPMPHFIWVCEIAKVDEYRTGKVIGEVLWDATKNAYEPDGWIALHVSDVFIIETGAPLSQNPVIEGLKLNSSESYELFRSNLHCL